MDVSDMKLSSADNSDREGVSRRMWNIFGVGLILGDRTPLKMPPTKLSGHDQNIRDRALMLRLDR